MRLTSLVFLLFTTIRGRRFRTAAVAGGLAIGALALGLATVIGLGTVRSMDRHLRDLFPPQRIVLHKSAVKAFGFRFEASVITPATVKQVESLPGVTRVSPEMVIRFPICAQGSLMGQTYTSDITVAGVQPWLLEDAGIAQFTYDSEQEAPLPLVVSHYFLDLYNMSLAESNRLPKFSESAVIGRNMDILLGISSLNGYRPDDAPNGQSKRVPGKIVGLTRNPDLLGIIIPIEAAEAFNEWYGLKDVRYSALHVEVATPEAVDALRLPIEQLGLEMRDRLSPWRRALVLVRLVAAGFVTLGALVFVLALAYMLSAYTWMLSERRRELALYRALGASAGQIVSLIAAEISITCLAGIATGLGAAFATLEYGNAWYTQWRGDKAFLPEQLFAFPAYWVVVLGVACWVLALALSMGRVVVGARSPIAQSLSR